MLIRVTFLLNSFLSQALFLLHDDMEQIRMSAYLVRGNAENVASFTEGKRVLYHEAYGRGAFAAIYEKLNDRDMRRAREQGLSIETLSLQKLFLYLIEGGL